MSLKCELTPMELFFCAKVMQGKYLDYDYFRRTPDIQINYVRHEQETLESLDEEGIVELDFDGNAEKEMETFLNEEKVEIYLADVTSGSKNGVFTAEDLKSGIYKEMAMSLLKGEL